MLQAAVETESTLTDRFQTTVPSVVRQALHLEKKDKIKFTIQPDGSVLLSRSVETQEDPIVESFLAFVASDMQNHPEKIQPLSASMRERIEMLTAGIELDLDAPLADEDE
ncbi:type II toxin-antitoxin system PrlF family antitoxin [Catenovulum maritimum]|uniref:Regulator n=1 Tax=Catenovulum maritimum TaxID=1513271 RepID=A0A0J8GMX0_9ALTE|nr:type II toxin-antitoxin system PrlF family antitoxin [Catenovulum maritimum]KMT64157.1 regulator [Catenovulum maritimum]